MHFYNHPGQTPLKSLHLFYKGDLAKRGIAAQGKAPQKNVRNGTYNMLAIRVDGGCVGESFLVHFGPDDVHLRPDQTAGIL